MQLLQPPYLLFLGDARDPLAIKTARGVHVWRPERCIGQLRTDPEAVSLDLEELTVEEAAARGARTLIVGTVSAGGLLPDSWVDTLCAAARAGLDVASGLHRRLHEIDRLREAAESGGARLIDVRDPGPPPPVGTGQRRSGTRVLTVGTDCNLGKMYTALALERTLQARGVDAHFKATGQTGILIAGGGVPLDAVISDFLSGAIEGLSPAVDENQWHIIEGQGSLHHPAFAGVTLGLIHGSQPDHLVVCHEPTRTEMRHSPGFSLPTLAETVESTLWAARRTNPEARCSGFSINTSLLGEAAAESLLTEVRSEFGLPAVDAMRWADRPDHAASIERLADQLLG